jgi:hypothetical protein
MKHLATMGKMVQIGLPCIEQPSALHKVALPRCKFSNDAMCHSQNPLLSFESQTQKSLRCQFWRRNWQTPGPRTWYATPPMLTCVLYVLNPVVQYVCASPWFGPTLALTLVNDAIITILHMLLFVTMPSASHPLSILLPLSPLVQAFMSSLHRRLPRCTQHLDIQKLRDMLHNTNQLDTLASSNHSRLTQSSCLNNHSSSMIWAHIHHVILLSSSCKNPKGPRGGWIWALKIKSNSISLWKV